MKLSFDKYTKGYSHVSSQALVGQVDVSRCANVNKLRQLRVVCNSDKLCFRLKRYLPIIMILLTSTACQQQTWARVSTGYHNLLICCFSLRFNLEGYETWY